MWPCKSFTFPKPTYQSISFIWISDSEFAIKCGGPQLTTSTQTLYEKDNETLGPATYYVTNSNRWAVSNVGYFLGNNTFVPVETSLSNFTTFTNAFGSELYQTARLSASSLRYYGLGLQNGNYTVYLQFAESAFPDNNTWKSLGKRVFDVYIQVFIFIILSFLFLKARVASSYWWIVLEFNIFFQTKFLLPPKFFHTVYKFFFF